MAIEEELALDISDALRAVDRVGDGLDRVVAEFGNDLDRALRSTPQLDLDIDPTAITRALSQAVNAAGAINLDVDEPAITAAINRAAGNASVVRLPVDLTGITAAINAAVARANTSVTITGNAANVTAAINGAVNAANTNVNITGQANVQGLDDASSGFTVLGGTIKTAATALAGFVGIEGISRLVSESSDLTEAQTKVQAVFGDSAAEVEDFALTAAGSLGQARSEALAAAGTFGNFFTSAGISAEAAADLSTNLVVLASDLASFNNLDPGDAITKLQAGLAGEAEPLRRIGISLTEAAVAAKAVELGIANAGDELDQATKIQARYALIMELSANAQGDFARTSDGLANQQRILAAQFKDVLTVVGAPLVSPLLSLLQQGLPLLTDAADGFGRIAGAILPAVDALVKGAGPAVTAVFDGIGDAADDLAPTLEDVGRLIGEVIGATAPVIGGVTEVLQALLVVVRALVDPLVAVENRWPALAAAIGIATLAFLVATGAVDGLVISLYFLGVAAAANPLGAVLVVLGALAVALGVVNAAAGDTESIFERVTAATEAIDQQFSATADTAQATARAITRLDNDFAGFIETSSTFAVDDQLLALSRLGVSYAELRTQLRDGARGMNEFASAAVAAGEFTIKIDGVTQTADQVRDLDEAVVNYIASGRAQIEGNEDLLVAYQNELFALQSVEEQTFNNLVAQGQLSQAQADAILKLPEVTSATDLYGAALRVVETDLAGVNASLDASAVPLGQQGAAWVALSDAILRGTVTSNDYQAAADALGVSLETVEGFAGNVTEKLDAFVSSAVEGLPQAEDAFDNLADGLLRGSDPQQVITNLDIQTASIRTFIDNIAAIRTESPEAADFLLKLGEATAGPFAQDLVDGTVTIEEFQAALDNNAAALADSEQAIRDSAIGSAAFELGAQASEELGLGLDFSGTTQDQIDNLTATLDAAAAGRGGPVSAADQLGLSIGRALTDSMKEELGINSPSRVAQEVGRQVAEGLALGLGDRRPVIDAATGLGAAAIPGGGFAGNVSPGGVSIEVPVTVAGVGADEAAEVGQTVGARVAEMVAEVLSL